MTRASPEQPVDGPRFCGNSGHSEGKPLHHWRRQAGNYDRIHPSFFGVRSEAHVEHHLRPSGTQKISSRAPTPIHAVSAGPLCAVELGIRLIDQFLRARLV